MIFRAVTSCIDRQLRPSPDNPGPPFSARSAGTFPAVGVHDECERRARAGAGKATTPEDKTSSREDEDKPGIAPAARCESSELRAKERKGRRGVRSRHGRKNST